MTWQGDTGSAEQRGTAGGVLSKASFSGSVGLVSVLSHCYTVLWCIYPDGSSWCCAILNCHTDPKSHKSSSAP